MEPVSGDRRRRATSFVYVNNHFAGHSPQSARDFQRLLGQHATEPEQIGEQMSLF